MTRYDPVVNRWLEDDDELLAPDDDATLVVVYVLLSVAVVSLVAFCWWVLR